MVPKLLSASQDLRALALAPLTHPAEALEHAVLVATVSLSKEDTHKITLVPPNIVWKTDVARIYMRQVSFECAESALKVLNHAIQAKGE